MNGSITRLVRLLPDEPQQSMEELWRRFRDECIAVAERRVAADVQRAVDPDQIVNDAFLSFFHNVCDGKYPDLNDREAIWNLLSTMVCNEACNHVRKERRLKRGAGLRRGESVFIDTPGGIAGHCVDNTAPDSQLLSSENARLVHRLIESLPNDLQTVARMKAEGESNITIARRLGCDPSTVGYRLEKIRRLWSEKL